MKARHFFFHKGVNCVLTSGWCLMGTWGPGSTRTHRPVNHPRVVMERSSSAKIKKGGRAWQNHPAALLRFLRENLNVIRPVYAVSFFFLSFFSLFFYNVFVLHFFCSVLRFQLSACIKYIHCRTCVCVRACVVSVWMCVCVWCVPRRYSSLFKAHHIHLSPASHHLPPPPHHVQLFTVKLTFSCHKILHIKNDR